MSGGDRRPSLQPRRPFATSPTAAIRSAVPAEDAELTHTGRGTALGEYTQRLWQPVCLTSHSTGRPLALRVLNEDLITIPGGEPPSVG